jgi:1-deoxy-D-xylulose-5-phosphate synthase
MQRAYDMVTHDGATQKNHRCLLFRSCRLWLVKMARHMVVTIAYMRCVPHMIVSAPMNEVANPMYTAQLENQLPFFYPLPRMKEQCLSGVRRWKK